MSVIARSDPLLLPTSGVAERDRFRHAIQQLEGVFVQQLFAAMRDTVPDEGVVSGGSAEAMFTSMLDEEFASRLPATWDHDGLGDAILRQFRSALPDAAPAPASPGGSAASAVPARSEPNE